MSEFMHEGQDELEKQSFQLRCAKWLEHVADNNGAIDQM